MLSCKLNFISAEEKKWIKTAADVVAAVHVPHFLKSTKVTRAANNDLCQIQNLLLMRDDPALRQVADALLGSHKRHSWYLNENLIMLSVLNDDLTEEEREGLCQKLLSIDHSTIQIEEVQLTAESKLKHFVGPQSWTLFKCLGFNNEDLDWLKLPCKEWSSHESYVKFGQICNNIICTNDVAERAIKLVQVIVKILAFESNLQHFNKNVNKLKTNQTNRFPFYYLAFLGFQGCSPKGGKKARSSSSCAPSQKKN